MTLDELATRTTERRAMLRICRKSRDGPGKRVNVVGCDGHTGTSARNEPLDLRPTIDRRDDASTCGKNRVRL
jgi:hypothetical protein